MNKLTLLLTALFLAAVVGCGDAKKLKDAEAQNNLDWIHTNKRYADRKDTLDADAQCYLGRLYAKGLGVPKDLVKAVEWYRKAAEQGYADAQYSLAEMYDKGEGVPKDSVKAVEWFRKAAEQGDAAAQSRLGSIYGGGLGVPKNLAKAVEWERKAAEQGHALAQFSLGWMYQDGEGVPKDEIEALAWFNLAAADGSVRILALKCRENAEANVGREGTLAAQQRSREILKEIEAAKAAKATAKGNQ